MSTTGKQALLQKIASEGYNVGYTAKLHFATLDIAAKVNGWVTMVSIAVAAISLFQEDFGGKWPTVTLMVIAVGMLYVRQYEENLSNYAQIGKELNNEFKRLHDLSDSLEEIPSPSTEVIETYHKKLRAITDNVAGKSISKQIFLANWYAHYKFFWASETQWVSKHRSPPFSFFRDKLPLSLVALIFILVICAIIFGAHTIIGMNCSWQNGGAR